MRRSRRIGLITFAAVMVGTGLMAVLGQDRDPQPAAPTGDYLSTELRARVERLKREVAAEPTTAASLEPRTQALWKWANAYAKQGGMLPVELPLTVALVSGFPTGPATLQLRIKRIDQFVRELQIHDERPNAIGTLTSDASKPFRAGSYQTIEQTYTVGRMPMRAGGGMLVAKHFLADHGLFQTTDPQAENYVTIRSSNSRARFVVDRIPVSGMHGGLFAPAPQLVFRLEGTDLGPGDTVSVVYGDRSRGSPGFRVQTYSNERFPLPLYVDLEGEGNFFTLPIVPYKVVGGEVHGVRGFAPSIVKVGEPLELSIRSEDVYYNRATGVIPDYRVTVNGEPVRTVPGGDDAVTVLSGLTFDRPGVYRFQIASADGKVRGQANPVLVEENPQRRVYWGETHAHSGFAEGQGTTDAFFRFGRDDARLDFLTHSEHDLWMDDHEWDVLKRNVAKYNEEGRFIAILGYEWTMRAVQGGHHNVFFRTAEGRSRVPVQEAPLLSDLYHRLRAENDMDDVLIIPHAHEPGDYRYSHPRMEPLVEIMSMHGRHEWFGRMYLKYGHQVGFIAASDDHLSHPGYVTPPARGLADSGGLAAVIAPQKTTDAIFDALKTLNAYATTGQRIILDFSLNGEPMGRRIGYADVRRIRARAIGTAPIRSITIVKNSEELWSKDYTAVPVDSARFAALTFFSPSDPVIRDSPRAWRIWNGMLEVKGARLVGVQAPSLYNPRSEWVRRDASHPNRVNFSAITRGSEKSIVLELEDMSAGTQIEVSLEPSVERYTTPSPLRRPARIPAAQFTLALSDMADGRVTYSTRVDRHTDTLTLRAVNPDAPLEQQIEYTDLDSPEHGDYYYVRVRQTDGGVAWSSPIWVGSYAAR